MSGWEDSKAEEQQNQFNIAQDNVDRTPLSPLTPQETNPWGPVTQTTTRDWSAPDQPDQQDWSLDKNWNQPQAPLSPLVQQQLKGWGGVTEMKGGQFDTPTWGMMGGSLEEVQNPDGTTGGFFSSPFGNKLKGLGIGAANAVIRSNPVGAVGGAIYDISQGANPLRSMLGLASGGNTAMGLYDAATSKNPTEAFGKMATGYAANTLGGQFGAQVAGSFSPALAQLGGMAGSKLAGNMMKAAWNPATDNPMAPNVAQAAATTPTNTDRQGTNVATGLQQPDPYSTFGGSIIGGLGALYAGGKANEGMQQQQQQLQQQQQQLQTAQAGMPSLAEMYGPNSPYALQLRQSLQRKDQAAGRNSQYGSREAQLQAMLAEKGSQYAAQQANSASQFASSNLANTNAQNALNLQRQQLQGQQLGALYNMGDKTGLFKGLGSLYDRWNTPSMPSGMDYAETPQAYDYMNGGPSSGVYAQPQYVEPQMQQTAYTPAEDEYKWWENV